MSETQKEEQKPVQTAIEMTDADLDNLSLFEGVIHGAAEYRENKERQENRAPISYVDEGSYWLRIYPEIVLDEGGNRRMEVIRRIWNYNGIPGVRRLPAPRENCPVREEVKKLKDAKTPDAWKYQAKEEGVIKAFIYRSSLPKDHKYIKTNKPIFLVLRSKQILALSQFLSDLSPEDLRSVLNPNEQAACIKMVFTKGSGGVSSFGFDLKREVLPPLPADFPSLMSVLLDETKLATPEDVSLVKVFVGKELLKVQNIVNVEDEQTGTNVSASVAASEREARATALVKSTLAGNNNGDVTDVEIKAEKTADFVCPRGAGFSFGVSHDITNVDCITCPNEEGCKKRLAEEVSKDVPM